MVTNNNNQLVGECLLIRVWKEALVIDENTRLMVIWKINVGPYRLMTQLRTIASTRRTVPARFLCSSSITADAHFGFLWRDRPNYFSYKKPINLPKLSKCRPAINVVTVRTWSAFYCDRLFLFLSLSLFCHFFFFAPLDIRADLSHRNSKQEESFRVSLCDYLELRECRAYGI